MSSTASLRSSLVKSRISAAIPNPSVLRLNVPRLKKLRSDDRKRRARVAAEQLAARAPLVLPCEANMAPAVSWKSSSCCRNRIACGGGETLA